MTTAPDAPRAEEFGADLTLGGRVDTLAASLWLRWAAPLALGALTSLSQAPASFWPLALLGPAGALALGLAVATPARAALVGWLFGVGYFLPGLLWIGEAFLVEADKFAWMRPFAVTLLPIGLALFWVAPFALAHRVLAARRAARPVLGAALFGAALWALAEAARGHVLTGFPWGLFAFAWIETPLAQAAAVVGPYGLTAATLAAAAFGAAALVAAPSPGWSGRRLVLLAAPAPLVVMAALAFTRPGPEALAPGAAMLRLVQPNVPQKEKWVAEFRQRNFDRLMRLTSAFAPEPLAYVVWPETATEFLIDRTPDLRAEIMAATPPGARLVLGSQRVEQRAGAAAQDFKGARFFNSLFVLGAGGAVEAVYDKHHLVPFGEYLPWQETLQSFGIAQLAGRDTGFTPGPGPEVLRLEGAPSFAPLICYEAIFPNEMPGLSARPELLLQITNDAWFGDSGGPWQHLVQARFRAIEQGLPLVRAANTGVTASIDPLGRVERFLGLGETGAIDVRPMRALPATYYARSGDLPSLALTAALALAGLGLASLGGANARPKRRAPSQHD